MVLLEYKLKGGKYGKHGKNIYEVTKRVDRWDEKNSKSKDFFIFSTIKGSNYRFYQEK